MAVKPANAGYARLLCRPIFMSLAIFVLSFSVHILHIAQADWGAELWSPYPVSDSFYYVQAAWYRAFLDTDGGYMGNFIPYSPYVRLLTGGFTLLGPGYATPFLVNALLMSGTAVFTALVTYRLFSLAAAWLAGCGFIFGALVVFFAGLTVKTNAELFFIAGSSYFFICFLDASGIWRLFLSLLFLGLAVIDRNNYAVVLLPYVLFAWRFGFPDRERMFKLCNMAVASLAALLLVGSIAGWQSDSLEQPFLSPVGLNYYVGNSPGSRGTYTVVEGLRDDMEGHFLKGKGIVEEWVGRSLTRDEVSQYWFKRSWDYYRQHPLEYFELQGRKALLLVAAESYGLPEQLAVGKASRASMVFAPVSYALVLALAMATFFCTTAWRDKPQARVLVYALIGYTLSIWVFFVGERYRLPIFMLLLPFAANTLLYLWQVGRWPRRLPALLVISLVLFGSHALVRVLDAGPGWSESPQRMASFERSQLSGMRQFYRAQQSAVLNDDAVSWDELARFARERRFLGDAQFYAERAILRAPEVVSTYRLLADVYHLRRDQASLEGLAELLTTLDATDPSGRWKDAQQFTELLVNLPLPETGR